MPGPEPQDSSYTTAQVLVLERLTRIETLLEMNYETQRETREKAHRAFALAEQHDKHLDELMDGRKWAFRTGVLLVLGFVLNLALTISQSF